MDRLLVYIDEDTRAGLDHQASNLRAMIAEAHSLGRRAIAPSLPLLPAHNFGVLLQSSLEKYFNLRSVAVEDQPSDVLMLDDQMHGSWPEPIFRIGRDHAVTGEENRRYRTIVRSMAGCPDGLWRLAPGLWPEAGSRVFLPPSDEVIEMADALSSELGSYTSLHLRRGDKLGRFQGLHRCTRSDYILRILDRLHVKPGSTVYLATNERDESFFDPISRKFDLRTFRDFPTLAALVEQHPPDNFMLYAVEKQIFRRGRLRIATFPREDCDFVLYSEYTCSIQHRFRRGALAVLRRMKLRP